MKNNSHSFRILTYATVCVLLFSVGSEADAQNTLLQAIPNDGRPNIILLMADDLGWGDVGFNGNEKIRTPHLDRMADQGVVFANFYAAAPLCSPTRGSCLTGRSPFRYGVLAAHTGGMRTAEITIAEVLKKEGYATGFFGKWHLGWVQPEAVENRGYYSPPWQHGFEEVFATRSAVPTWNPTRTPEGWDGFGSREDGSWGGSVYVHNGEPVSENLDGDDSRIIMDRAIPFIRKAMDEDKPFLSVIWFHAPHEPIVAGPEYIAIYPDLPEEQQHLYGVITAMDEQIGRLREFLNQNRAEENTILFFCSDNGPADPQAKRGIASAGPYRGHKHQMWEGGLRVPSLMLWPGMIRGGSTCEYQAGTVDYFPTLLEILNVKPKDSRPMDGVSLMPALRGTVEVRPIPIASGYRRLHNKTDLYALISDRYKICVPDKGLDMQLYDLENDPYETMDLSDKKPEIFGKMKKELREIKESWQLSRDGMDYTF